MKTLSSMIKIVTLFLFAGMMFFSCSLSDSDYGTLVIKLPGGARAAGDAVSLAFTNTLRYRIKCNGEIKGTFKPGPITISLTEGVWEVTVEVLNAADDNIVKSGGTTSVVIEAGKTTTAEMTISIDTSRNEIKSFAITNPVKTEGKPNENNVITIFVRNGTNVSNMDFSVVHAGRSITHYPSDTRLNFNINPSYTFTVIAENGAEKSYTVMVEIGEPSQPQPVGSWPTPSEWQSFGLSGIRQPAGTTGLLGGVIEDGILAVVLNNATPNSFDALKTDIENALGLKGETLVIFGIYTYTLNYTYQGRIFGLAMSFGLPDENNMLTFYITPNEAISVGPSEDPPVASPSGGYPSNPFEDEYTETNFPTLSGAADFIGTWKGDESSYYSLILVDTGRWTLKWEMSGLEQSVSSGRFLVSENKVYLYEYDDFDAVYYMNNWGTKTGNSLAMEGGLTYIGESWTKQQAGISVPDAEVITGGEGAPTVN